MRSRTRKTLTTIVIVAIAAIAVYFFGGSGEEQQEARPVSDVDLAELAGSDSPTVIGDIDVDLARKIIDGLGVADYSSEEKYDRIPQFGDWQTGEDSSDPDYCGDTREDTLNRDLTNIELKDGRCQIASGDLDDPYTGKTIHFVRGIETSGAVQIDHLIPLGLAWRSGAESWTQDKRVAFANDEENLIAVDGPANGSKSDQPVGEWMPENEAYACTYVARFAYVANKYELSVSADDKKAMIDVIDGCA